MLLLDVSNIMYTGASSRPMPFGQETTYDLYSIPYFFATVAAYYEQDHDMIAVFENVDKIPALARSGGYKSGRTRNPLVEWEVKALKALLKEMDFPILEIPGQESDYIINNYCRINRHRENISILSADMDLAANVCKGKYETKMLSFSSVSYDVNKGNFKHVTGVDYNFMDLNKLLLGCNSDKIPPFPNGEEIYDEFRKYLDSTWRRKYGYDKNTQTTADFADEYLFEYTNLDYFMKWFESKPYNRGDAIYQLQKRRLLVQGPQFDIPEVGQVDWNRYNKYIASMNLNAKASNKAYEVYPFNLSMYDDIARLFGEVKKANATLFEGKELDIETISAAKDISNVLGLLESEGDL